MGIGVPLVCFHVSLCQVKVPKTILRCGHIQMVPCSVPESDFCCQEPCPAVLKCGHRCSHPCGEDCVWLCSEMVTVELRCVAQTTDGVWSHGGPRHGLTGQCAPSVASKHPGLWASVSQLLATAALKGASTGRAVSSPASACSSVHPVPGALHWRMSSSCQRPCQNRCVHSQCKKKWGTVHPAWNPASGAAGTTSAPTRSEPCNRPPCYGLVLSCWLVGYPCIGLCGEPCPKKCRVCHQEEVTQDLLWLWRMSQMLARQLEDCSHILKCSP